MVITEKTFKKPFVVIFGDDEAHTVTKTVWSLLSGNELQLASTNDMEELEGIASGAVLILISIQGVIDKNNELALQLAHNRRVVCDVVAVTDKMSDKERMQVLAQGFDGLFNLSSIEQNDFKKMLMNRIEKGFVSLENCIQQEEYRRFKASLAASPDAFIVFDENDKLFFVSEHYKKAYPVSGRRLVRGLEVMDAFKMCSAEQGVDKNDSRYPAMRAFWEKMDGEAEFQMDDGRIWHIKAKKLPQGQGTIVTTTDITRYKAQQRELQEKSDSLSESLAKEQEASAIQKQFINMVSHEFRTPLSIIDGNAQILQRRATTLESEDIEKRARTIRSAVSRLVNMMEGVLSSNMLKTGRLNLEFEPVDIKALIKELCDEHTNLSANHIINVDIEALPDMPILDRKFITLVISNILSNAIKFSLGNPEISIRGWQDNTRMHVEFQDNGIGIAANELDKVFERYYRTTTASGIPGSGIGLNLAKDLIELHKGEISVESKLGEGTKFVISLPYSV